MPRTKRITTIEETGSGEATPAEELVEQDKQTKDELDSIEAARQRLGGSVAKAMIYRYDLSGNPAYCGPCAPDVISDEFLQSVHGAGRYVVKFIAPNGRYLDAVTTYIAAPPGGEAKPATGGPAPVTREDLLALQVETLKAEMVGQREMTLKLIEKIGSSSNGEKSSTVAEIVTAIGSLGKLIPEPPNVLSQIRDLVGILKPLGFGAPAAAGSNWTDVVRDVLASVPQIMETIRMKPPQSPQPAPAINPAAAPAQVAEDPAVTMLRRGIVFLKQEALDNQDWQLWVDFIMAHLAQAQWQPFVKFLELPFEEIAKLDPDLSTPAYRPWFEQLFTGLKNAISDRAAPDGESGDLPHALPDA